MAATQRLSQDLVEDDRDSAARTAEPESVVAVLEELATTAGLLVVTPMKDTDVVGTAPDTGLRADSGQGTD